MSNEHIEGNLSTSQDITAGGDLKVRGDSTFDHDVVIKGWLDAHNLKHVNKGMFQTLENLKKSYPVPKNGWWAIVGDSLPGPIYVGWKGMWIATGNVGGNPTIDSECFENIITITKEEINEITGYYT